MMEFFLPFRIDPLPFKVSYEDSIFLTGSCFSEEIGSRMAALKLPILSNPNGILFNPLSIRDALTSYIDAATIPGIDLVEFNGLWHSWKHHSSFSGPDKQAVMERVRTTNLQARLFLKNTRLLIVTFGTAFGYRLKNGIRVANCHKAPAALFEKIFSTSEKIVLEWLPLIETLQQHNPDLQILFTISPVRHVKDGLVENNRSKASLIEAVHQIIERTHNVSYFPSYELVTDVLRDYRFYKNDLVHPNETAVNYVFEKFLHSLLDRPSLELAQKIQQIVLAAHHKPFFIHSTTHQEFIAKQMRNIYEIEQLHPAIDFQKEKNIFAAESSSP